MQPAVVTHTPVFSLNVIVYRKVCGQVDVFVKFKCPYTFGHIV